jgi:hypothetical protein
VEYIYFQIISFADEGERILNYALALIPDYSKHNVIVATLTSTTNIKLRRVKSKANPIADREGI